MSTVNDKAAAAQSETKLAHELANLIDGSLRNMNLAMSQLHHAGGEPALDDALMQRLEAANAGLEQMAMILRRWMRRHRAVAALHERHGNLASAVEHATRLLGPVAAAHGVLLQIDIDADAGELPAGPLYPVIANALRNAIDAIAANAARDVAAPARVALRCNLHEDQLKLTVTDTGPGVSDVMLDDAGRARAGMTTKPGGFGIGLTIAADIAAALEGSWSLSSNPSQGATFELICPAANLAAATG